MKDEILIKSINCVNASDLAFCKFISANETEQKRIAIPRAFRDILPYKCNFKIKWDDSFETNGILTYNSRLHSFFISGFGEENTFYNSDLVGSLFVFSVVKGDCFGFFLNTEEEMENFLAVFGISITATGKVIKPDSLSKMISKVVPENKI